MKNKNKDTPLEIRTKRLLGYLDPSGGRRKSLPRPFIVEVTGPPASGKTTVIDILDDFFRRQEHKGKKPRVLTPLEGAKVVRNLPDPSIENSIARSNHALQILIQQSYSAEYDLVFFDRCVYDGWCWMEYRLRKKDITSTDAEHFKAVYTYPAWRKNVDICFFIMCDPEVANKRNKENSVTEKSGSLTNPKDGAELNDVFETGYRLFKEQGDPVVLIDTTNLSKKQVAEQVLIHALDAFERRFKKSK